MLVVVDTHAGKARGFATCDKIRGLLNRQAYGNAYIYLNGHDWNSPIGKSSPIVRMQDLVRLDLER